MSKTATKIASNPRAVVIYQDHDERNRQRLIVRNAKGKTLFECRHIKALARFLKSKSYNFYEYKALPRSAREAIDNLRSEHDHRHRSSGPRTPKLADVWPS